METNNHISYIEIKTRDLASTKSFYQKVFEWEFTDYGPEYTSFQNSGVNGGFVQFKDEISSSVLLVLYHSDLNRVMQKIKENGGTITKDIFTFPGGKRFHFID